MRASARHSLLFAAALGVATVSFFPGCSESNDVTGPAVFADVSGEWSGQYASTVESLCANNVATASFSQRGNQVTGVFKATGCGVGGNFRGTVSGNTVTGKVSMPGCTGGYVNGVVEGGALSLTVGDFRKDLIAGDAEVLPGGQASLQR
jgi:hypothetical protein